MLHRAFYALFSVLAFCPFATLTSAGTVNGASIATLMDGQPARAGDVNGNFNELIAQINDNAGRIGALESDGLVSGGSFVSVDCAANADGPNALQDAISDARNTTDSIQVEAVGVCNGVRFSNRLVSISTTAAGLTIKGDASNEAVDVRHGSLSLFATAGSITLDGDGLLASTLITGPFSYIFMLGNVNVVGATESQVAMFQDSELFVTGTVTLGTANDGITGLRLEKSMLLFASFGELSTLNIASSGSPLKLDDSVIETFDLNGSGNTFLSIPNGSATGEIAFADGSTAQLGPSNISVGSFRVVDNSSVSLESNLFPDSASSTWNANLLIDRESSLRLNVEDAPGNSTFTHAGNIEVSTNSSLELFGPRSGSSYFPGSTKIGDGQATEGFIALGGVVTINGATLATDTVTVFNGSLALAQFARLDDSDGTPPALSSVYNGIVIDVVDDAQGTTDTSTLSGDIAECSAGGVAYDSSRVEACP